MSKHKPNQPAAPKVTDGNRKRWHERDYPSGQELVDIDDVRKMDAEDENLVSASDLAAASRRVREEMLQGTFAKGVNRGEGSFDSWRMRETKITSSKG